MFSDLDRKFLIVPLTLFAGDLPAARVETVKEILTSWRVLTNSTIVGMQAGYAVEVGTTPALTFTLERGTTVLATVIATTVAVPAHTGTLEITATQGEVLNVKVAGANTDNDVEGLLLIVEYQPLQNSPSS
jgi:hypothetical protein